MYILNDTIHFKSEKEMYEKERDGLKSNTVRLLTSQELKMVLETPFSHIQILNKDTNHHFILNKGTNHYFTRKLTDISYIYNKEHTVIICIFSW